MSLVEDGTNLIPDSKDNSGHGYNILYKMVLRHCKKIAQGNPLGVTRRRSANPGKKLIVLSFSCYVE